MITSTVKLAYANILLTKMIYIIDLPQKRAFSLDRSEKQILLTLQPPEAILFYPLSL